MPAPTHAPAIPGEANRMRPKALPMVLTCLVACGSKTPDGGAGVDWVVGNVDLGPDRVGPPDAAFESGGELWETLEIGAPQFGTDDPAADLPLGMWELLQGEQISDMGSCPYRDVAGSRESYRSDCRSRDGYEWRGGLEINRYQEGEIRLARYDFDLEVVADIEDPSFDSLRITGSFVYASEEGEGFQRGLQANLEMQLVGFWSRQSAIDPREVAWSDLAWNGRYEEQTPEELQLEMAVRSGGSGSARIVAHPLIGRPDCSLAAGGRIEVEGVEQHVLTIDPEGACGRCAEWETAGTDLGLACGS
jgi:hypothetical protein